MSSPGFRQINPRNGGPTIWPGPSPRSYLETEPPWCNTPQICPETLETPIDDCSEFRAAAIFATLFTESGFAS